MLTFPPGVFSQSSTTLPILFRANGVVALNKPAEMAIDEHPWNKGQATLCGELRSRISAGSAVATALGVARPVPVVLTDREISGVVLLADREGGVSDAWRNAFGSEQMSFRFVFLAKQKAGVALNESFPCSLPVSAHFSEPHALISHKTGKKSLTQFSLIEKFGEYSLWRAETAFPRLHQIRLHAAESGLPIVGESLYGSVPPVVNTTFCRKGKLNKGEERPLYSSLCLHLEEVDVPAKLAGADDLAPVKISAPLPNGFSALLKKLRARRGH